MDYLESLKTIKSTFIEGKDKSIVATKVARRFSNRELTFLDVGVGDGTYIKKLADSLAIKGIHLEVTGIDPLLKTSSIAKYTFPQAFFFDVGLEEYSTSKVFDIVQSRQSLYYVEDKCKALDKLINLTSSRGLLIINLWSKNCVLFKLHCQLTDKGSLYTITAEDVYEVLCNKVGAKSVNFFYCVGNVDFPVWTSSTDALSAAYQIITRIPPQAQVSSQGIKELRRKINQRLSGRRVNGLIFVEL